MKYCKKKKKKEKIQNTQMYIVCVHLCFLSLLIFIDIKYIKTEIWGFIEIHGIVFELVELSEAEK